MRLIFITIIAFLFAFDSFAQSISDKDIEKNSCPGYEAAAIRSYFKAFADQQNEIAMFEREAEERRRQQNVKKPLPISFHSSIAIVLVKPYYPAIARKLNIFGDVVVETFSNESGNVVFSRVISGNSFLSGGVKKAACASKFSEFLYRGNPIKKRFVIRYRFLN